MSKRKRKRASDAPGGAHPPKQPRHETPADDLPHFRFTFNLIYNAANEISLRDWLNIVDMQKKKLNWSDNMTIQKVLFRLQSLPDLHGWFNSMGDILGWEEWKNKLLMAFPKPDDYCLDLKRAMKRKRSVHETYVNYFKDKLALLERLNITGEKAVSCIIPNCNDLLVSSIARMGNYQSPEEMLDYFTKCDEKEAVAAKNVQVSTSQTAQKVQETNLTAGTPQTPNGQADGISKKKMKRKCQKCHQMGHLAINCTVVPLMQSSITSQPPRPIQNLQGQNRSKPQQNMTRLPNQSPANKTRMRNRNLKGNMYPLHRNNAPQRPQGRPQFNQSPAGKKKKKVAITVCNYCGKNGHKTSTCPYPPLEELKRMQGEGWQSALQASCIHCGDTGHVSFNCPRSKQDDRRPPAQIEGKTNMECGFCLKLGHNSNMCHEANRKAVRNAKRDGPYQQNAHEGPCSFCGSTRHVSRYCGRAPQLNTAPEINIDPQEVPERRDQQDHQPRPPRGDVTESRQNRGGHNDVFSGGRRHGNRPPVDSNTQGFDASGYRTMLCLKCYKLGHNTELCPRYLGSRR